MRRRDRGEMRGSRGTAGQRLGDASPAMEHQGCSGVTGRGVRDGFSLGRGGGSRRNQPSGCPDGGLLAWRAGRESFSAVGGHLLQKLQDTSFLARTRPECLCEPAALRCAGREVKTRLVAWHGVVWRGSKGPGRGSKWRGRGSKGPGRGSGGWDARPAPDLQRPFCRRVLGLRGQTGHRGVGCRCGERGRPSP